MICRLLYSIEMEIIVGFKYDNYWRQNCFLFGDLAPLKWRLDSDLILQLLEIKLLFSGDSTPLKWRLNSDLNIIITGDKTAFFWSFNSFFWRLCSDFKVIMTGDKTAFDLEI